MGNQEKELVLEMLERLKRITNLVKILPFFFSGLYIVLMTMYFIPNESLWFVLDTFFYVSPVVAVVFTLLSKTLGLCNWHRTACVLPVIPQAFVLVDKFAFDLTRIGFFLHTVLTMTLFLTLLICAFNVFYK